MSASTNTFPLLNINCEFLHNFSALNMLVSRETVSTQTTTWRTTPVLWNWPPVLFVCPCSPSGQGDGGAVCAGDGVAPEHRPGQEIHLALLGEQAAAGDVLHLRLGHRAPVSFTAAEAQLSAKWSEANLTKWEVTSHLWCYGLWEHALFLLWQRSPF